MSDAGPIRPVGTSNKSGVKTGGRPVMLKWRVSYMCCYMVVRFSLGVVLRAVLMLHSRSVCCAV